MLRPRDMWPRLLLPLLLLPATGCSSDEGEPACGALSQPLAEGASVRVEVRDSDTGVAPVSVDGDLYGPVADFASPPSSPRPPQSGVVAKKDGRLVLTVEDGRVIPLTLYFCD